MVGIRCYGFYTRPEEWEKLTVKFCIEKENPEATLGKFYQNFCLLRTVTIPCLMHVQKSVMKKTSVTNEEKKYEITSHHLLTIKAHGNTCLKLVNFIFITDYDEEYENIRNNYGRQ